MPATGTSGVISGSNHGSSIAPLLPAGVRASAAENSGHVRPNMSRTRSRASEPFRKHVSPMNAPVGDANTWPVPDASTHAAAIGPKIVSLVPSEIATRSWRTRPVPTRLEGLSPVHATTRAAEKP